MNEIKFWDDLTALSPEPVKDDPNADLVFKCEEPQPKPTAESTSELLDKISALEKIIADMKNENNGNNLQAKSDLSDC